MCAVSKALEGQKREQDLLKLELQMVMSYYVGARIKLEPSV